MTENSLFPGDHTEVAKSFDRRKRLSSGWNSRLLSGVYRHMKAVSPRTGCRLAALALVFSLQSLQSADSKADSIARLMQAYADRIGFQGAVLVADKSEVIFERGYGFANAELKVPNTPETKFRLGSLTKQFTAMLVLQLAAEGKLKLDGALGEYLPEWPKPSAERITIHHLLSHQSGLPNYTTPEFIARHAREPLPPAAVAKLFWDKPLDFEPGAKYSYSNSGYHALGLVVEKLTGRSYEQALRERILDPLGMRDSGYDHTETVLPQRASGYTRAPEGLENAPFVAMSIPYSAGGLYSTVRDLRKWDAALYTEKLLPKRYLELMFKPAVSIGEGRSYGYGWMLGTWTPAGSKRELRIADHFGGIPGFSSMIARLPDDRCFVIVLANILGVEWGRAPRDIARILYGEQPELPKKPLAAALGERISQRGIDAAVEEIRRERDSYDASEGGLNSLGYSYLRAKKLREATGVFRLNTELFPKSWNAHDSLGEAYAAAGNRALALESYRKAVALNPKAESARKAIAKLEQTAP